jgi:hypothetical protein
MEVIDSMATYGVASAPGTVSRVEDRKRLNFNLTVRAFDELKRLSDESGLSMTEIMRLGLGLIRIAFDEERKGNTLVVSTSDGRHLKEIVLPR